jgi:hypothetical protein
MAAEAAQRGDWVWPQALPEEHPHGGQPPLDERPLPVWVDLPRPDRHGATSDATVIDCDRCSVRGIGCGDCVVTVLLGGPPYGVELDPVEERALGVLADAGLVPPLRMVDRLESRDRGDER